MRKTLLAAIAFASVLIAPWANADVSEKKKPGDMAVDFVGRDIDGEPVRLKDYEGKVILLDFWASWCEPCIIEFPNLVKLRERHHDAGFEIIGINMDAKVHKAEKFLDKHEEIDWPNVLDVLAEDDPVSDKYGVVPLPASFLVDRKGVIRYVDIFGDQLAKAVEALLEEEGPD